MREEMSRLGSRREEERSKEKSGWDRELRERTEKGVAPVQASLSNRRSLYACDSIVPGRRGTAARRKIHTLRHNTDHLVALEVSRKHLLPRLVQWLWRNEFATTSVVVCV